MMHILKPIRRFLMRNMLRLWHNIIAPMLERLHRWGVFEAAAWAMAAYLVLDGRRLFVPETGYYVSLTGLAAAIGAVGYSTLLHVRR